MVSSFFLQKKIYKFEIHSLFLLIPFVKFIEEGIVLSSFIFAARNPKNRVILLANSKWCEISVLRECYAVPLIRTACCVGFDVDLERLGRFLKVQLLGTFGVCMPEMLRNLADVILVIPIALSRQLANVLLRCPVVISMIKKWFSAESLDVTR